MNDIYILYLHTDFSISLICYIISSFSRTKLRSFLLPANAQEIGSPNYPLWGERRILSLLFSSQASHIAVYCLSSSTRGNRYDLAWVACKAETPISDNCSEMCLCRGAWGNKLTTNIITASVEQWKKFWMETGRSETHWEKDTVKQRERERAKRCLCIKRSHFELMLTLLRGKYTGVHSEEHFTRLPPVLFNPVAILRSCWVNLSLLLLYLWSRIVLSAVWEWSGVSELIWHSCPSSPVHIFPLGTYVHACTKTHTDVYAWSPGVIERNVTFPLFL